MGWIYRDADQHRCAKPGYDPKIKSGDIWQCDNCKRKYKVVGTVAGKYDQRDGWYGGSVSWTELSDPTPYWRD